MDNRDELSSGETTDTSFGRKYNNEMTETKVESKYRSSTTYPSDTEPRLQGKDRKHRSRSRSPDECSSPESEHRRHRSRSAYKHSYYRDNRKTYEDRHYRNTYRSNGRARYRSSERAQKKRERYKREMRQLMAKNYAENIGKVCNSGLNQTPLNISTLFDQIQERKLLWSKAEKPVDNPAQATAWNQTKFTDASDCKETAKFKRLMGMKNDDAPAPAERIDEICKVAIRKKEAYFAGLEKQYEVARATTHIQRGLGLGFCSQSLSLPIPINPSNK